MVLCSFRHGKSYISVYILVKVLCDLEAVFKAPMHDNAKWVSMCVKALTIDLKPHLLIVLVPHCGAKSYSKEEFDPGSEGTLAICLTHASRTSFSGSWAEGK